MVTKRTYGNLTWINLASPTSEEIRELVETLPISPRVAEELLSPTDRPKLDVYPDYVYLILHFPTIRYTGSNEQNQEVDFIISERVLVTVHYDAVDAIEQFAQRFEVTGMAGSNKLKGKLHAGFIFYHLILELYRELESELDVTESKLKEIERNVFMGEERQMVEELSVVSRDLLDIEHAIESHGETLRDLLAEAGNLLDDVFTWELRDILRHYRSVYGRLKNLREFVGDLRTTNDSLLTTKQNEVMKVLTILAFVTFPLALVAGIFGMNISNLPFAGSEHGFLIIMGIMAGLTLAMFAYFKLKRWL